MPEDASVISDASKADAGVAGGSGMDASEPLDASDPGDAPDAPDASKPDAMSPSDSGEAGAAGAAGSDGPSGSCAGLPPICGADHTDDCCATSVVPGGTFKRDNDALYPATVSAFRLDKYEVTVGRFRKFYNAVELGWRPALGSGKNPHTPGDLGWNRISLTHLSALLLHQGPSCSSQLTWTPSPVDVAGESRPVNCIDWESAFAFCIWDGGRLPSEAEWSFAATGGGDASGQRQFPWSSPSTSMQIDPTDANYHAAGCSGGPCQLPVGSRPNGNGRFGQADLSGNVAEWVLDWGGTFPLPCVDCIATQSDSMLGHVLRGGSYEDPAEGVRSSARYIPSGNGALTGRASAGMRCSRDP